MFTLAQNHSLRILVLNKKDYCITGEKCKVTLSKCAGVTDDELITKIVCYLKTSTEDPCGKGLVTKDGVLLGIMTQYERIFFK